MAWYCEEKRFDGTRKPVKYGDRPADGKAEERLEREMTQSEWTYSIEQIDPLRASLLLQNNHGNRPLKKTVVSKYAATMISENWVTSPEPICLSPEGRLLNGQHRLNAVISSGVTVEFLVIRNVSPTVFKVLDRGVTRTVADAIGVDKKLAEVARLGALVASSGLTKSTSLPDAEIEVAAITLQESHGALLDYCRTTAKIFSSAPFRLAACVRIMSGHYPGYVFETYRDLVLGHISKLPPVAQNAVGSVMSGRWDSIQSGSSRQLLDMARAWDLFDFDKAENQRLSIKSTDRANGEIRAIMSAAINGAST